MSLGWRITLCVLARSLCLFATTASAETSVSPAETRLTAGFRLEVVYQVPADQGSWVALTSDYHGRLVASDQSGSLYLISPPPVGQHASQAQVEAIPTSIGEAQGLACVGDDLYLVVNSASPDRVSGLYRARDRDGDGLWDKSELLRPLPGKGEHGPHAVIADHDAKHLLICCGNNTAPLAFDHWRLPPSKEDDVALCRLIEPTPWHAPYRSPPAGWIARTDLEGRRWELVSGGYRNQYDIAINRDGELFAYDSDMEYDIGTPWYRPTRVCHVTSGLDAGWRSGAGKFPPWFADTLPPVAELGPGSPTGLVFGYDTNFPFPYRNALFAADWGRGIIHAVFLEPDGASYRATTELFLRATPLPVTDLAANPIDGALYFTTGGRGVQSAMYRIVYLDDERLQLSKERFFNQSNDKADARALRLELESLHRPQAGALDTAWPALDHPDRFVRYAARLAVEHQDVADWRARALAEPRAGRRIAACLALVRREPAVSPSAIVAALTELPWGALTITQRRDCLRTYEVMLARHGRLADADAGRIAAQLVDQFPSEDSQTNRSLVTVLSRTGNLQAMELLVDYFEHAWGDEDRIHLAYALCDANSGWTSAQRTTYFRHLCDLLSRYRQNTLCTYLDQIATIALENTPNSERSALKKQIEAIEAEDGSALASARPRIREWTTLDALEAVDDSSRAPDLARGERLFVEAKCAVCHRFRGRGGAVGPDLTTVAGRFSIRDLITAIVEPDQVVSDRYRQTLFQVGGRMLVGTIIDQREGHVRIATNMADPKRSEFIPVADIELQAPSDMSPMPRGLIDVLDGDELVDLIGFLRAEEDR